MHRQMPMFGSSDAHHQSRTVDPAEDGDDGHQDQCQGDTDQGNDQQAGQGGHIVPGAQFP